MFEEKYKKKLIAKISEQRTENKKKLKIKKIKKTAYEEEEEEEEPRCLLEEMAVVRAA